MNLYQAGGKENIEKALAQLRWVVRNDPTNVKAAITVNKIESQLRIGGGEIRQGPDADGETARAREQVL